MTFMHRWQLPRFVKIYRCLCLWLLNRISFFDLLQSGFTLMKLVHRGEIVFGGITVSLLMVLAFWVRAVLHVLFAHPTELSLELLVRNLEDVEVVVVVCVVELELVFVVNFVHLSINSALFFFKVFVYFVDDAD